MSLTRTFVLMQMGVRFPPAPRVGSLTFVEIRRRRQKSCLFAGYLSDQLGPIPVVEVKAEMLISWQSSMLDRFAPFTVLNCRKVCSQVFSEAVHVGLIASNPFDFVRAPRAK